MEGVSLPHYRLLAEMELQAGEGDGMLCGGRFHDLNSRLFRQKDLDPVQDLFLAIFGG